jgi:hypothetical protein
MLLLTKILEEYRFLAARGRPLKEAEKDIFDTFV